MPESINNRKIGKKIDRCFEVNNETLGSIYNRKMGKKIDRCLVNNKTQFDETRDRLRSKLEQNRARKQTNSPEGA